jgi:RimJ/RimL family protein N-acetyltransferase
MQATPSNKGISVIEGDKVDLLSPFPEKELKRLYGWLRRVRTELGGDETPKSRKDILAHYSVGLASPNVSSWGIIDKGNITSGKTDFPIVGFVAFEKQSSYNGYIHLATTKEAFNLHLIDEAVELAVKDLYARYQTLLRISAMAAQSNWLVKELARRTGFVFEGTFEDSYTYEGDPRNVVHYGLTRRRFEGELCRSLQLSRPLPLPSSEPEPPLDLVPLVNLENREARPKPGLPVPLKT